MKSRTLKLTAGGLVMLALIDVALAIPALRAAAQRSEFPAHDTYVVDVFGLPWWVLPAVLLLVAVAFFVLSRRATKHASID